MKNSIALLLLASATLALPSCSRKCCSEPKGFRVDIFYKTKAGKNLFTNWEDNNKGRYDTRNIEVYKVINNDDTAKEPLEDWLNLKKSYGDLGYPGLLLKLPTDDKRINRLLIYLYPSQEVDTISYTGEGPYNFPETKNIFYNGTCIESMNLQFLGGSRESTGYTFTVTKPD